MGRGADLSARFGYSAADQDRWVVEPAKRTQSSPTYSQRTPFERDRARVLHSYAFRRLADKTQVVSPGQDDFPRTRLTHSLEVAQIAREMGARLGCDPDITDAAGLAHDLGHPPFGHNGETALNEVARDIGGFEGNAQTLRILTRLEAKVFGPDERSAGLNLTRAGLDAVCKYPWQSRPGTGKFGVYADDLEVFEWLRDGRPDGERCLEAQVMDWADDVAYSVHDVEDGVHSRHIDLALLDDDTEREALCRAAASTYSALSADELQPHLERLLALPALRDVAGYDGSFRSQAAVKSGTSELTGRFVGAAVAATREKFGSGPLGRYAADLIVPADIVAECALLKAIAYRYVMRREGVDAILVEQRQVIAELAAALHEQSGGELRPVVDRVAQLTDSAALAWHARLVKPHHA
jgi:dGTPase